MASDDVTSVSNVTTTPTSIPIESAEDSNLLTAVIGILSFFSVIGTVGNLLVVYVYIRKRNKLASTVFIITLAFTDFLTCIFIIPLTMALEYMKYYVKYDFFCKFYMFLITSNVPFSAFIMVAIAVDRYLCICHPFLHILSARRAKYIIFWLAMIAFSLGIITSLNYGVYYYTEGGIPRTLNSSQINVIELGSEALHKLITNGSYNGSDSAQNISLTNSWLLNEYKALTKPPEREFTYDGTCKPNGLIFSQSFTKLYQKVYSSFFVIVLVAVIILYVMIYRFVSVRRARRQRMRNQRSFYSYSSCRETCTEQTFVQTRASFSNGCVKTDVDQSEMLPPERPNPTDKVEIARQLTIREKGLVANIRTAAMLFVVTAIFIVVFLPAWLMAHQVVPYNILIFYMYFFYNVANPIVYAFMNKAFRRDLRDVLECTNP